MGRDYKLRAPQTEKYEDGYENKRFKKLDSYDRNKTRRQNKFNLNKISIEHDDISEDYYTDNMHSEETQE